MGKYIALKSVQVVDTNGVRQAIEPKSDKHSGLFEHTFDAATEKRLLAVGAIRKPEGTEQHDDPTKVEALADSRVIEGEAKEVDALDHDGDGKKGGAKRAPKKAADEAPADEASDGDAKKSDGELLG